MNQNSKIKKYDEEFDRAFYYDGTDLGCSYSKDHTVFRIWAPGADRISLKLYREGLGGDSCACHEMEQKEKGIWELRLEGDLNHVYYTFLAERCGEALETTDPYIRAAGANGVRGMVLDMEETNPADWEQDRKPCLDSFTDAVIYETHIRDISVDENSGIQNKGRFLGLAETGTRSREGLPTGLDHIKELGVTHIHLLPVFDYGSVDETRPDRAQFNWGYDPVNYNVPEGSYSSDAADGAVRIREFKQLVKTLHDNGLRVIMDVVYNHTYSVEDTCFTKLVPGYYYRRNRKGYTNGSGCGNETASERAMFRKYMVDSVLYWASEYHVDGFRFDLMGVHDIDTMNEIEEKLHRLDPTILIYGEGWKGGSSALPGEMSALKKNAAKMPGIGFFNDDIRDNVKGDVFILEHKGFVNGKKNMEDRIRFSITGAVGHSGVIKAVPWAAVPAQSINYVSAHDNLTLWDKLALTNPEDQEEERIRMNRLAAAIVFTSQGIPFIQAGEELLRTKPSEREGELFDENSYCSSDAVNCIRWERKSRYKSVTDYYRGLIAFRKKHPALRLSSREDIWNNIRFLELKRRNIVAYTVCIPVQNGTADHICVVYNANCKSVPFILPDGKWDLYVNDRQAGINPILEELEGKIEIPPISAMVFCSKE